MNESDRIGTDRRHFLWLAAAGAAAITPLAPAPVSAKNAAIAMNAPDREAALDLLLAEAEIARLSQRYGHSLDTYDFETLATCFHSDARIQYSDAFSGTLPEAITFLRAQLPKLRGTMHTFFPTLLDLDLEAGTAAGRTYAINTSRYPESPDGIRLQTLNGALYTDRFEKRAGVWRIAARRNESVWSHTTPESEMPSPP